MLKHDTFYTEENFDDAWRTTASKFKGSRNLNLLQKVIDRFLLESQDYYVSQWLAYLDEIKLEEFEDYNKMVTVSTIHKSKGMEFNKVILLQKNKEQNEKDKKDAHYNKDNDMRLYYVGMTRAKNELTIFRQGNYSLNSQEYAKYYFDSTNYVQNKKVVTLIMGLGDINLGYKGHHIFNHYELIAGSAIELKKRERCNTLAITSNGKSIGCLSQSFYIKVKQYLDGNYTVNKAIIDFVVFWHNKDTGEDIKHPLCKIVLKKKVM